MGTVNGGLERATCTKYKIILWQITERMQSEILSFSIRRPPSILYLICISPKPYLQSAPQHNYAIVTEWNEMKKKKKRHEQQQQEQKRLGCETVTKSFRTILKKM